MRSSRSSPRKRAAKARASGSLWLSAWSSRAAARSTWRAHRGRAASSLSSCRASAGHVRRTKPQRERDRCEVAPRRSWWRKTRRPFGCTWSAYLAGPAIGSLALPTVRTRSQSRELFRTWTCYSPTWSCRVWAGRSWPSCSRKSTPVYEPCTRPDTRTRRWIKVSPTKARCRTLPSRSARTGSSPGSARFLTAQARGLRTLDRSAGRTSPPQLPDTTKKPPAKCGRPHGYDRRTVGWSGFDGAPTGVIPVCVARGGVARVVIDREAVVRDLRRPVVSGDGPERARRSGAAARRSSGGNGQWRPGRRAATGAGALPAAGGAPFVPAPPGAAGACVAAALLHAAASAATAIDAAMSLRREVIRSTTLDWDKVGGSPAAHRGCVPAGPRVLLGGVQ